MMSSLSSPSPLRVVYLGMGGMLSYAPLAALLAAATVEVAAVVVAADRETTPALSPIPPEPSPSALPLITSHIEPHILHLAWRQQIPTFALRHPGDAAVLAQFRRWAPDLICVSCFSYKIPPAILTLPPYGILNVHPSLLPHFRGPAPLFWQFRAGSQAQSGVTVHFMDEGLDTGDIALQAPLSLPDGIGEAEATRKYAARAAELLLETVTQLAAGTLTRTPQPAGGAYQKWPIAADFTLFPSWSAQRAFNFMRGTAAFNMPYPVTVNGQKYALRQAVSFNPQGRQPTPVVTAGNQVWLQFNPGVLLARV